jgi:hypothetical protein
VLLRLMLPESFTGVLRLGMYGRERGLTQFENIELTSFVATLRTMLIWLVVLLCEIVVHRLTRPDLLA